MHRASMSATTLTADDLVVAISSSGSTRDLLHVVKLARKRGAKVLALSNTPRSPLASISEMLLVAAKPEGPLSAGALNAKVGVMLLVELLAATLISLDERYGDASQQTASATLPLLL
jgi:DNA-binding MurR/RpiR family transcriptional regulator